MKRHRGRQLGRYLSDYVVFDLETTGVNIHRDTIIEISAVKVENGRVAGEFTSLVNPHRHIPEGASAINHITDDMVKDAPDLKEAVSAFLDFAGDSVLVGHNIHNFDINFIYDAAWELLGKEIGNDYVDTLFLARKCLPQLEHHTLRDVSSYFGIDTEGAHRALQDCRMTQECYERLGGLLQDAPAVSEGPLCPLCGRELRKRKGRFGEFYGCSGFPHCRYTRNV